MQLRCIYFLSFLILPTKVWELQTIALDNAIRDHPCHYYNCIFSFHISRKVNTFSSLIFGGILLLVIFNKTGEAETISMELIRWLSIFFLMNKTFDLCIDRHCQFYQNIFKANSMYIWKAMIFLFPAFTFFSNYSGLHFNSFFKYVNIATNKQLLRPF